MFVDIIDFIKSFIQIVIDNQFSIGIALICLGGVFLTIFILWLYGKPY